MPGEQIATLRKKINSHFLIISFLAILFIALSLLFRDRSLLFIHVIRILTFFLVIHTLTLYQRRNRLFKIFDSVPTEIISTFENYLQERKQHADRNKFIRIGLIVLLTIGMLYELFDDNNQAWSGSLIPLWFAAILLMIADKWVDMNTHIILQDLKHNLK